MPENSVSKLPDENNAACHLAELGYVDPLEVAAVDAESRARHEAALRAPLELWKQGRGADAAALLEKLIQDAPMWIAPRRWMAEICYLAKRFDEAQTQLDWLTWHGVESPQLSLLAGGVAIAKRDLRGAVDLLEYSAYVEPALPSVHVLLGTALLRLGRLNEATGSFQMALDRNKRDTRAFEGMAAVCLREGDYEDAADWALHALEQDMQLFRAHYTLGLALARLHRLPDAVNALETAARVDPRRGAPYYWLRRIADEQLMDRSMGATYRERGREVVRRRMEGWRRRLQDAP